MTAQTSTDHASVMVREVLAALNVQPGGRYVDGTAGGGGHALAIMEAATPGGALLGIDRDPQALEQANRTLARFGADVRLHQGNFADIAEICRQYGFEPVHGVLLDLGLSSLQLEEAERGFSFQRQGPLDMRFDP
ncbi:MAG: 16S rRNA (cytosine(1402)-N(4))-methyltransferase, partial [Dehalococcoidia bacterium]|nr:16S rRNA (cytosine(1402)-N(4))-methyltransferase [Dehalococcoidia bacterium]